MEVDIIYHVKYKKSEFLKRTLHSTFSWLYTDWQFFKLRVFLLHLKKKVQVKEQRQKLEISFQRLNTSNRIANAIKIIHFIYNLYIRESTTSCIFQHGYKQ